MPACLDSLSHDDVHACSRRPASLLDRAHLEHDLDSCRVTLRHVRSRVTASQRHDGYGFCDTDGQLTLKAGLGYDGRHEVDAKWMLGECACPTDLLANEVGRHADHAQYPKPSRVAYCSRQLGAGDAS